MCGIAGMLDPEGVDRGVLEVMARTLAHRGPDDHALLAAGPAGLAFRRLSIIDLETGAQPIGNEDGSVQVVLNGEIYNYRELRRDLVRRGHAFRSRSDTEVLAHLYEEKGADLVDDLRGMFAIAIWDARRETLLLARDHLGQKPLYWARRGRRFWFASEIKAILAVAPAFRTVDPHGLDEYLTLRILPDPRSMFEGISKLPPAHVMEVAPGGEPCVRRYWRLAFEPKLEIDDEEALERLDHEVRESVRLHLVADVPVGAFLSGGIDSALVASYARELIGEPLRTFTLGVPYRDFDEAPAAGLLADHLGTLHTEARVDGGLIETLPMLVHHLDEPSDPLSACVYHLAERARRDVKVVLGGDGGDELFGGYDRYYGVPFVRHVARLPAALRNGVVRRLLDLAPDGAWYKSLGHQLRWILDLADVDGGRRYARSLSWFHFTPELRGELYTDGFRERVAGADPEAAVIAWYEDGDGVRETLDRMLMADSVVREPNHPVMVLDRMTMAHGLEARSPFLDHRLAGFAGSLPVHLKVHGRRRRVLQTRLAERRLSPELLDRPKQGFSSGLPYLMGPQFRTLFRHYLTDARLAGAGLLRAPAMRRLLEDHLAGRADHAQRLWLLLNAEIWYRVRIEEGDPTELGAEMAELLSPMRSDPLPRASRRGTRATA